MKNKLKQNKKSKSKSLSIEEKWRKSSLGVDGLNDSVTKSTLIFFPSLCASGFSLLSSLQVFKKNYRYLCYPSVFNHATISTSHIDHLGLSKIFFSKPHKNCHILSLSL